MPRRRLFSLLKIAGTIVLVGGSLYFSMWKVNLAELAASFRQANYWIACSLLAITVFSHWARAWRWKTILAHIHPGARMPRLFAGVMVGYFMNNVIPRSGEFARPYVTAHNDPDTNFPSLLGTIVVERFIDSIALLLIVAGVLLLDDTLLDGFEQFKGAVRALLYPAIGLGVLFILIAPSALGVRLARFFTRPLPARFRGRVMDIFLKLQTGFSALRSTRQLALVVAQTAVIYASYLLPLYVMFFAFPSGRAAGPSVFAAAKLLALTAMATAVAPTPGAFGVFHVTARIAVMNILHFTYADAVAYAALTHFMPFIVAVLLGGYYTLAQNISFRELRASRAADAGTPAP
jgi:glycosyltransferase 2 family protein